MGIGGTQDTTTEAQAYAGSAGDASTVCEAFQITAGEHAERIALRTPGGAVELTYAELAGRVRAVAAGLHSLGVRRGDTVVEGNLEAPASDRPGRRRACHGPS
jgi:non-ribosomal peptide synthetase component E (peptide arylation enzyme)